MMGYRVKTLQNVKDAVVYLNERKPDAIILDVESRDSKACKAIAEATGEVTKIVVISEDGTDCPDLLPEVDAAIEKPISIPEIKKAIDS